MESSAVIGSFHRSVCAISPAHCSLERPGTVRIYSGSWPASRKPCLSGLIFGQKNHFSNKRNVTLISCVKTPEATVTAKSNDRIMTLLLLYLSVSSVQKWLIYTGSKKENHLVSNNKSKMVFKVICFVITLHPEGFVCFASYGLITIDSTVPSDHTKRGSLEKETSRTANFPNGFEALVLEVCDETEVAELKMKIGDFEMHLKRNVGATKAPLSSISPITAPPIPTKPMNESVAATLAPSPPKSSPEKVTPFKNTDFSKSSKLAALEASGSNNYVLVPSPIVGTFRRGRTVKGKKQPPICKEGDLIKEGQVIGFLDQFGTELPVKSDVAGEVLKLLFDDGDGVGYGDALIAVLPSFHPIN